MNTENFLKSNLREIPDFPKPGINFYDVSTLFKDPECLDTMLQELYNLYKDRNITKVIGIESRGFVLGSMLAHKLNAGFVMCRKPGKLPAETISETYEKEYGTDTLEIHTDALSESDNVLIHDDLLATGGTILATINLAKKFNVNSISACFLVELTELSGRSRFPEIPTESILKY